MTLHRPLSILLCALAGCFTPDPTDTPVDTDAAEGTATSTSGTATTPTSDATSPDTGTAECANDDECADADPCSIDACAAGTCTHEPDVDNPACACSTPADCVQLPEDDECRTRTCDGGVCGLEFTAAGTPLGETQQMAEDCKVVVCDGAGAAETIDDDADVPDDGLECTSDACEAGVPVSTPAKPGTPCAAGMCNADGQCTGCTDPSECGGESTFCQMVTCVDSICGIELTPLGTALPEQTDADCQQVVCDGRGNAASIPDDDDVPADDGNDCTGDTCQAGAEVHPDLPTDTGCDQDGGLFCDGAGACVECTQNNQCGGGSACLVPACVDGGCTVVPAAANTPCSDGMFCTANDACNANGVCVGSGNPCPGADGDGDCSESCNEGSDNCTANDASGTACTDNLFCTQTDTCNASGTCVGSGNPCPGADGDSDCSEMCNETADACSGNDPAGADCGACRTCNGSGTCNNLCNALAMCCPGDVCISMGQSCP